MISLCVPSRGRPDMLKRLFKSAADTGPGAGFEICVRQDYDDRHADRYPIRQRIKYVKGPRPIDARGILRMSELWTEAARISSGDILGLIGDDSVIETVGWAEKIEAAFASVPDRIVMVYPDDCTGRQYPETLFVHRKWMDAIGEFTPAGYPGWYSDVWIWTVAAELKRAIYLPEVKMRHLQGELRDDTLRDGQRAREKLGGQQGLTGLFWSYPEKKKRATQVTALREVMDDSGLQLLPEPEPIWVTRAKDQGIIDTMVTVHCYAGDRDVAAAKMPYYQQHGCPVLVMSPDDSPVLDIDGAETFVGGKRGYFGKASLDRQLIHLRAMLGYPYDWFLMNDSDSLCISREIPRYLYGSTDTLWANVVRDPHTNPSPYPKVALQPPYFAHRSVIARLLAVDPPKADPTTPYIDWFMMALAEESGTPYRSFPDGASFCAWKRGPLPETQHLGHDYVHVNAGPIDGETKMIRKVLDGATMLHSIKHLEVLQAVASAHERFVRSLCLVTRWYRCTAMRELRATRIIEPDLLETASWSGRSFRTTCVTATA